MIFDNFNNLKIDNLYIDIEKLFLEFKKQNQEIQQIHSWLLRLLIVCENLKDILVLLVENIEMLANQIKEINQKNNNSKKSLINICDQVEEIFKE